jgi:hypothetical protein
MAITVKQLSEKHPDWAELRDFWAQMELLYRGGKAIVDNAAQFLDRRPAEAQRVYDARCAGATYQNILGAALGWYESKLFSAEPQFYARRGDAAVQDEFLQGFLKNCDRCGKAFVRAMAEWFSLAVRDGSAYVLLDLPSTPLAQTFRAQKMMGALDPYVVTFTADQVTNWETDAQGNFEWIVISTSFWRGGFGTKRQQMRRWHYFDRTDYRIFEATADAAGGDDARMATEVGAGRHALADQARVPIHRIAVPFHLWLGYRVYPQVRDHFNADNGLKWALLMANLAVPVVTGDFAEDPKISETGYIKLEANGTFGWSEPSGSSFQHAAARVASLREEIYRQMYLQAQGRDSSAQASANSGYSKEMDMAPSRDVLNGYGELLRGAAGGILADALAIRGRKDVEVSIQGLHFEEGDELQEIGTAQAALELEVPSETFERAVLKRTARQYVGKADPDTLAAIDKEIDAAPTRAARQEAQRQQRAAQFRDRLAEQLENGGATDAAEE